MSVLDCVTISPRLSYSVGLAESVLGRIDGALKAVRSANADEPDRYGVGTERRLAFCHEALSAVHGRLGQISDIRTVPDCLPAMIPAVRAIGAALHCQDVQSSRQLAGIASVLGSVLVDSAAITGAKFDFDRHNRDSQKLLNQAKLSADSKIRKQYPNLDTDRDDMA